MDYTSGPWSAEKYATVAAQFVTREIGATCPMPDEDCELEQVEAQIHPPAATERTEVAGTDILPIGVVVTCALDDQCPLSPEALKQCVSRGLERTALAGNSPIN